MAKSKLFLLLCTSLISLQSVVSAGTTAHIGAYVKADFMNSVYGKGRPPDDGSLDAAVRDFVYPLGIRTDGNSCGHSTDFSSKWSVLFAGSETDFGEHKIITRFSTDHLLSEQGNRLVGNAWAMRIKQFWVQYQHPTWGSLLAGQEYTTFMDLRAWPDVLDWGVTAAALFVRQPMLRYTYEWKEANKIDLAAESPETAAILNVAPFFSRSTKESCPDMIARYTRSGDFGFVIATVMARLLEYEGEPITSCSSPRVWGGAVNVQGRINVFSADDIRFMASYGQPGRYTSYASLGDGCVLNGTDLQRLWQMGLTVAYRRQWSEKFASSIAASGCQLNKNGNVPDFFIWRSATGHINLLYSPWKPFRVGLEYIYGYRKDKGGAEGDLHRVQFSVEYFWKKVFE